MTKSMSTEAREAVEGKDVAPSDTKAGKSPGAGGDHQPSAGPHADPSLMNSEATPGAGALTPTGSHDEVDSTSG